MSKSLKKEVLYSSGTRIKVLPSKARQVLYSSGTRIKVLPSKARQVLKLLKGFSKDPFSCLMVTAVFLFGLVSLLPYQLWLLNVNSSLSPGLFLQLSENKQKVFVSSTKSGPESPDLSLIGKNSLKAIAPSLTVTPQVLGVILGETDLSRKEIIEYIVQSGDSLWSIAESFDISLDTLLWANDLNQSSIIKPGQKLIILPVSGVVHHIQKGDTLSQIAQTYKGKVSEIVAFNELSAEGDIYIGDILIIPEGVMPPPPIPTYVEVPIASSYFICPIASPCRLTQGLHWYNAVDLSHGLCGEPIYAAAGGQVLRVRYGWNQGAGNYITILHPNSVVTMYGHLATILVGPGQSVSQGQTIAYIGGQPGTPGAGKSTGCHLHFGVRGSRNPLTR